MLPSQRVPQDVRARTKLCLGCGMQAGLASDARLVHSQPVRIFVKSNLSAAVERRDAGRQTRSFALNLASVGDDGMIEGYGSVFGVRDSYSDIVAPGAFKASLAAHKAAGTMPALLWQHDASEPIGVWVEVTEDQRGLRIKGRLAMETARGKEAHTLLKMGALNGLSIGFYYEGVVLRRREGHPHAHRGRAVGGVARHLPREPQRADHRCSMRGRRGRAAEGRRADPARGRVQQG